MEIPAEYLCRVCLEKGASLPIFETKGSVDPDIFSKLCQCLSEQVEDRDGYPRHICQLCHSNLNAAVKFIEQYKASAQILELQSQTILNHEQFEALETDFLILDGSAAISKLELINVKQEPNEVYEIPLISSKDVSIKKEGAKTRSQKKKVLKPVMLDNKNINEKWKAKEKLHPKKMIQKSKKKSVSNFSSDENSDKLDVEIKLATSSDPKATAAKERKKNDNRRRKVEIKSITKTNSNDTTKHLCSECGKMFKDSKKLLFHKQSVHMDPVKCPHCPKMYHEGNIKEHIKRIHLRITVPCSYCGKGFARKSQCILHEKYVHEGIPRPRKTKGYICEICKEEFWNRLYLQCHMRRVHTGERPEVCSVCGKRFTHAQYLATHMLLHTGERPYKCPVCNKGHTNKANMKSHIRHNHRLADLDAKTIEELSKSRINYLKHFQT